MVFAWLTRRGEQARLGVCAVVFAVVGEQYARPRIGCRLRDLALRRDVFIPMCAIGTKRAGERAARADHDEPARQEGEAGSQIVSTHTVDA
jgi:hypothetical protein